jgi:integrase/recombinase XerD
MLSFDIDLGNLEKSAKKDHHGQAKILSDDELAKLFTKGFQAPRDRALFAICFFTGCRVSEACQLRSNDLTEDLITFRKATTKGKGATRQHEITESLRHFLAEYDARPNQGSWLFPGRHAHLGKHMTSDAADKILREACKRVGLVGVSTHSFRRTYITKLRSRYTPMQIKQRTGHKSMSSLMHYFDQL